VAIVVSDTSPIRALHHLGLLDLLERLFERVYLPDAVALELRRSSQRFGPLDPNDISFFTIQSPHDLTRIAALEQTLDGGEAAALALAMELRADYVLMDELAGRRTAHELGLTVIGVLGVLSEAKARGLIPALRPLLARLQTELGFHLSVGLTAEVLRRANEEPLPPTRP
jgi:uncharacterized protein